MLRHGNGLVDGSLIDDSMGTKLQPIKWPWKLLMAIFKTFDLKNRPFNLKVALGSDKNGWVYAILGRIKSITFCKKS